MNEADLWHSLLAAVAAGQAGFAPNVALVLKIRSALDAPDCHVDEAVRLLQAEPVLAVRVVAAANSVLYNPYGREVADLRTAVSRMGFQALRNLAMALVVREMTHLPAGNPARELSDRLWDYTVHVAALARLVAREVTGVDGESAAFAAIVHDLGGFYLLSRAAERPELLRALTADGAEAQVVFSRTLLRSLAVPEAALVAIEAFWAGSPALPPSTLGDTLLLAAHLSPTPRPLCRLAGWQHPDLPQSLERVISGEGQGEMLAAAGAEVHDLRARVADADDELRAMMAVMQY